MRRVVRSLFIISAASLLSSCVTFAPPSPLMTMGGPKTTSKGESEAAVAVGMGAALFDGAHAGAQGWFGRYKYGISEKTDLGIDFSGASRNDGQYFAAKIAGRYQVSDKARIELGIGGADDSSGKSLNTDVAITLGTIKDKTWNYYMSLRYAYAGGFAGNSITLPGQTKGNDSIPPPNTSFVLLNLGAQAEITKNQRMIFEGGYGYILPEGVKNGPAFYIAVGLVFNLPNKTHE